MGVPTSEAGYTPALPRREDHEVHKEHVVGEKKNTMGAVQMIVVFWILTPCTKNLLTTTMTENGVPFKSSGVTITTNRTALSFLNIS